MSYTGFSGFCACPEISPRGYPTSFSRVGAGRDQPFLSLAAKPNFISAILSHGIPLVIVAGVLGHSISILLTTYDHFIPTMQDQAAQLMDDILTPIRVDFRSAVSEDEL